MKLIIDVHTHIFCARDIPLKGYLLSRKPEKIIEKIVEGKLKKFYSEATLLEQQYVKNPDMTIQDLLNEMIAKTGENIVINRFTRYQLGETNEE